MSESERSIEVEMAALKEALVQSMASSSGLFEEVAQVWGRMGLSVSQRETRRRALAVQINNLLKEIVQEEIELEKSMITSLQTNEAELASLCRQLALPPEQLSLELSLYEREKSARQRVDALNKIKFERQKRLKRIKEMETSLCKELGEKSQVCVDSHTSHLPSEDELKKYLKRVEGLEQTLSQRRKKCRELQHRVKEVSVTLEMGLGEEFALFSDREFVYTSDSMEQLESTFHKFEDHIRELERTANQLRQTIESLWERLDVPQDDQQKVLELAQSFRPKDIDLLKEELERLTELKREHMETFMVKTRAELHKIWKDCLYGEHQQREFAPAFVPGPFDDDLLSAHESEVDRMRGFYHDNAEIFKLIKKREEMFNQYCELEHKDNDPSRFSNRGGQLLKDQATKKQLKKELPRLEKGLREMLEDWEEDHERFFMVLDARYLDTMTSQWKEKEENKCLEKMKRLKEKETITMLEMTYGSKPSTPKRKLTKRTAASPLPATAPSKLRKVEASPSIRPTTASGSRLPRARAARKVGTSKTPVRPPQRRVGDRRKILADRNTATATASGGCSGGAAATPDETVFSSHNFSLASAGSYTDFQHGITSSVDEQKRSSVIFNIPKSSSLENVNS